MSPEPFNASVRSIHWEHFSINSPRDHSGNLWLNVCARMLNANLALNSPKTKRIQPRGQSQAYRMNQQRTDSMQMTRPVTNQILPRRTSTRNAAAARGWTLALILLSGCAIHPPIQSDLPGRLPAIKSVAISPPYVTEYYEMFSPKSTREVKPLTSAKENLARAVREQFERPGWFVITQVDLGQSPFAPKAPPWGMTTSGPLLVWPHGMNFKPAQFTCPPPEIDVDAVLFPYAWERTRATRAIVGDILFGAETLPLHLLFDLIKSGDPQKGLLTYLTRREVCVALCLIDCHSGEILWSDIEMAYGVGELGDSETANRLVGTAFEKFRKFASRAGHEKSSRFIQIRASRVSMQCELHLPFRSG